MAGKGQKTEHQDVPHGLPDELIATAAFGLESVVKRELLAMGCTVLKTEDGRVTFRGGPREIARANYRLRTSDRVLLKMGEFPCRTSDELFFTVRSMPWEKLIPPDGKFTVNASTVKSALRSEPNTQRTAKKAIVERLAEAYGIERFPETGAPYTVKVSLLKDRATVTVDTSGDSLHRRGYRPEEVKAPMKETLAAALVELSFWNPDRTLIDPCTGSGTIAIEAALIGRNIAPGLNRHFAAERWPWIPEDVWRAERAAALGEIRQDAVLDIRACDIDENAVRIARESAERAGVDKDIAFTCCDMNTLLDPDRAPQSAVLIANPPYGSRIGEERQIHRIYGTLRAFLNARRDVSLFLVTSDKEFEKTGMERKADRRRKLYNGRIEVCYYQYHGERPERRGPREEHRP